MKKFSLLFLLVAINIISATAQAQTIQLGTVSFGGNGCPAGTATAVLTPDASGVSILFDKFSIEQTVGQGGISRLSCRVKIPINIPLGYAVGATRFDYRGFAELPAGTSAKLSTTEMGKAKGFGGILQRAFASRSQLSSGEFTIAHSASKSINLKKCGRDSWQEIDVDIALEVQTPGSAQQTVLATLDTADVGDGGGLNIGINLINCADLQRRRR